MTAPPRAYAPGKLFLFGEYAVLAGRWAIVSAVERGVTAAWQDDEAVELVDAVKQGGARYRVYTGREWLSGQEWECLPRHLLNNLPPEIFPPNLNALTCDLSEMMHGRTKLGLGSSAATCAALAKLLLPKTSTAMRFKVAAQAHRAFQEGAGSQADVAASCFGGVLGYRLSEPLGDYAAIAKAFGTAPDTLPLPDVHKVAFSHLHRLPPPPDLKVWAYWLGKAANTRTFLQHIAAAPHDPATQKAFVKIDQATTKAWTGFAMGDSRAVIEAATIGRDAMQQLGAATETPIWTPDAERFQESMTGLPVACKMSGSGGGDFILVFGRRGEVTEEAVQSRANGLWLRVIP